MYPRGREEQEGRGEQDGVAAEEAPRETGDAYDEYLHVYGNGSPGPGFECAYYKVEYKFESGCF